MLGEVQIPQPALSRLHSKLEPASLEEKVRVAEVDVVVAAGPPLTEVCGGVVSGGGGGPINSSTVQVPTAGVVSTFSAVSIARTKS